MPCANFPGAPCHAAPCCEGLVCGCPDTGMSCVWNCCITKCGEFCGIAFFWNPWLFASCMASCGLSWCIFQCSLDCCPGNKECMEPGGK